MLSHGSESRMIDRWKKIKPQQFEKLKCPICDSNYNIKCFKIHESDDLFHAGKLTRYECPNCNVIFGDLRFLNMNIDEINRDYNDLYSYYKEYDTTDEILISLNSINILCDKKKSYLDYACGKWNDTVKYLKNDGYNIIGYDKYVKTHYSVNDLGKMRFDVIYANNFIEHTIRPIDELIEISKHLNEDGKLILISPCFEYCYHNTHYHTFYFIGKSIEYLCHKTRMKELSSKRVDLGNNEFTIVKIFTKL